MSPLPPQPVSPLDGRYRSVAGVLGEHLSEAGLNRARVHVEVEWLIALTDRGLFGTTALPPEKKDALRAFAADFGQAEIDELAKLEATTRHDVKAVEYLVRSELSRQGLDAIAELTHFAATSEDINNLSYALTIRAAVQEVWTPRFRDVIGRLREWALAERDRPMLSHTHGQPATPTTVGKEFAVVVHRLERQLRRVERAEFLGKFSGATGTFSAHLAADADADWPNISREFVDSLGLTWNPLTTQIESHDWQAELFQAVAHANRILHNLATDVWTYISMGYFTQVPQPGATGSSTMPHKINPIRFENAEANLELSNALLDSLAATLVTSRLQRDLTDSTTQRNVGVALGHSLLALDNLFRGLGEIAVSETKLAADLDGNWEVLAEAIQTVIRAEVAAGRSTIADPYALLKELTRGHRVGQTELVEFVDALEIGDAAKARLRELTPGTYVGLASSLVDHLGD
ncbi:adenylosuccinate lyase [Schumannella luteola]|uniref:Adenylosuccinate lyase n=1 Tax=Schumannella luteola TaxID=472059 RepID=A0A852YK28_9MICO|nr:adenylosuccinate lyase [Schumannella luteola]NYG98099.1 adenylosuccinate lyase [Schumannella luteola]TPX01822.1 adenylosuccinate lyase [Schumannella luteola]